MPRLRSIVHKELGQRLQRSFFTRQVSIAAFVESAPSASGFRTSTRTVDPLLTDLDAAIAPISRRGNEERRGESMTVAESTHEILLLGWYPQVHAAQAAIDDRGEVYDILRADVDDQRTLTRLQVRQVTPVAVEGQ